MAVAAKKLKALPKQTGVSYTAIAGLAPANLDVDSEEVTPDAHVIADQIVYQGKLKNKPVPAASTDLATNITSIAVDHTRSGASSLTVALEDPMWRILDSGFFDADPTGKLLDIDINYPDGSRFWWRLHQFSPSGSNRSIQLTFLPRAVAKLMGFFGPLQVDRATRTRAEFLKMLCAKVPEIEFYSKELDIKQPIANPGDTSATKPSKTGTAFQQRKKGNHKQKGIGANAKNLTCKGTPLDAGQTQVANTILQVGEQLSAPHNALVAAIYASMGESSLAADANTYSGTGGAQGPFQTLPGMYKGGRDVAAAAADFFAGKGAFSSPGAISRANSGWPAWKIANAEEANAVYNSTGGDSYPKPGWTQAQGIAEAEAIVAGGGGSGTTTASTSETLKVAMPYYFQVQQNEDYWSAMCRLAQEVGWELIADGDRIYYDADKVLITQQIAAVIARDDPTTLDWGYDWENRHLATNFKLNLVADPFEFSAGEVLQVDDFGVAAQGSTAKPPLPGRWLIDEITHTKGDMFSAVSLVQPLPAKPEPAPQYTTVSVTQPGAAGAGAGGAIKIPGTIQDYPSGSAEAAYAAAQYLASLKLTYTQGVRTLVKNAGQYAGRPYLDCSGSTSWILLAAGFPLPGNVGWGGWAPVSGDFFPGAAAGAIVAGPGKNMTIYWNASHVFIRIHPDGYSDMQGNTVSPLVHERGFDFFPWNTSGCGSDGGPTPGSNFNQSHYQGS